MTNDRSPASPQSLTSHHPDLSWPPLTACTPHTGIEPTAQSYWQKTSHVDIVYVVWEVVRKGYKRRGEKPAGSPMGGRAVMRHPGNCSFQCGRPISSPTHGAQAPNTVHRAMCGTEQPAHSGNILEAPSPRWRGFSTDCPGRATSGSDLPAEKVDMAGMDLSAGDPEDSVKKNHKSLTKKQGRSCSPSLPAPGSRGGGISLQFAVPCWLPPEPLHCLFPMCTSSLWLCYTLRSPVNGLICLSVLVIDISTVPGDERQAGKCLEAETLISHDSQQIDLTWALN